MDTNRTKLEFMICFDSIKNLCKLLYSFHPLIVYIDKFNYFILGTYCLSIKTNSKCTVKTKKSGCYCMYPIIRF